MSATTTETRSYVTRTPGILGGKPCVAGHRISVELIAERTALGDTPDDIARAYPTLTLAEIYGALAYYYENKAEIDASIADAERLIAEIRAKTGPGPLEQWLAKQKADDAQVPPG